MILLNIEEFIRVLSQGLQGMTQSEINDILYDYEEHFEVGLSRGKTQKEIINELGNPNNIAKSYKASSKVKEADSNPSTKNLFKALLTAIGLGFFNLIFVLGPFLLLGGLLLGLYGISIGFIIGGVSSFFGTVAMPFFPNSINISVSPVISLSIGVGLTALGLLALIASFYLTKLFYNGIIKYLGWNIDIINR